MPCSAIENPRPEGFAPAAVIRRNSYKFDLLTPSSLSGMLRRRSTGRPSRLSTTASTPPTRWNGPRGNRSARMTRPRRLFDCWPLKGAWSQSPKHHCDRGFVAPARHFRPSASLPGRD